MAQVLKDLKQKVFAQGAYERPGVEWDAWEMFGLEYAQDEAEREELIEQYGLDSLRRPLAEVGVKGFPAWLKALDEAPTVRTREDLDILQQFSSSGTSTILDITHVSETPEFGALFPVTPEQLREHFGTEQPTMAQFQQPSGASPVRYHERGQAYYIVLYKNGKPDEIWIEGSTGD